ncbi:class I SAM-dependent methyltransferase [Hyphobacterium sp. Y6023]|uniref:Class I SAM-dependent methyltransferase n=1 Tax=Hyphobacterium marinum TaxID=3116574 RepID=A0ABU7LZJ3_9PROT|nr:class I SAM-dependent methyltransferase [Hyphobacterium sp. Y6023]MEE2566978.1 class I SAM-dependent methyltransferase [Hyphobacterium sp. Y6023]
MIHPDDVKGFLAPDEGEALATHARESGALGPIVEIGSYCGKSALYLGPAAREAGTHLFSVDHHSGSEEHQPGEGYHDPDLFDAGAGRVDTLPSFRRTLRLAGLDDCVIPVVGRSADVARHWSTPCGLVFIDGGHSMEAAQADYDGWSPHVAPGGILAIHDVFPDPKDGGRPPYEIWKQAVESGRFETVTRVNTLEVLRRSA